MIDQDCIRLSDEIKKSEKRLFMSFSTGADSIAMFLRVLESGRFDMTDGVYWYMYAVPHISWIDEYIEYFMDKYKIKIIQVPSSLLLQNLALWRLQSPMRSKGVLDLQWTDKEFSAMPRDVIGDCVKDWHHLSEKTYCAIGVKSGDSAMRRIAMRKCQGVNHASRKWYPIWDFENRDVEDIIRRHGVKVPYDYNLFGITFENFDYRFSKIMIDRCPENWKRLLEIYPMAKTLVARHEYYKPDEKPKVGVKGKRLKDLCLEPRMPL